MLSRNLPLICKKVNTKVNIGKNWFISADIQNNRGVGNITLSVNIVLIFKRINIKVNIWKS